MIVKEAVYEEVMVKQKREVSPRVFGCDECGKEIPEYPNEESRLEVRVFRHGDSECEDFHFCSWACVLAFLPKVKTNHFATLPYILFDSKNPDRNAESLMMLLRK